MLPKPANRCPAKKGRSKRPKKNPSGGRVSEEIVDSLYVNCSRSQTLASIHRRRHHLPPTMAALRSRLLPSSTFAALAPRIGNAMLDAVFPILAVASPSPSGGGDLCGLPDLPSWLLRPGAGAGAAAGHQATLGRASAFEGGWGSRPPHARAWSCAWSNGGAA